MKKVFYVLAIILVAVVLVVILTGCTKEKAENTAVTIRTSDLKKDSSNTLTTNNVEEDETEIDYAEAAEKQMAKPEKGETIAIGTPSELKIQAGAKDMETAFINLIKANDARGEK